MWMGESDEYEYDFWVAERVAAVIRKDRDRSMEIYVLCLLPMMKTSMRME